MKVCTQFEYFLLSITSNLVPRAFPFKGKALGTRLHYYLIQN